MKMKTKKGAAKRFKVGGSGRVKRGKAFKRHNTGKKSAKQKRRLRKVTSVLDTEMRSVQRMLPYSF